MKVLKTFLKVIGILLLVIVILAVAVIGACWLYLKSSTFEAEHADAVSAYAERYAGRGTLQGDSILLPMDEGDLLWLIEQETEGSIAKTVEDASPVRCEISYTGLTISGHRASIYLDGTLLGVIPLHLKAEAAVEAKGSTVEVFPEALFVGQKLRIAYAQLPALPESFTFELDKKDITSLTFTESGILAEAPVKLLTDRSGDLINLARTAATAYAVLGMDTKSLNPVCERLNTENVAALQMNKSLPANYWTDLLKELLLETQDAEECFRSLMILSDAETSETYLEKRDAFTLRYLLPGMEEKDEEIRNARSALKEEREKKQLPYETALSTARDSYKNLNLRLGLGYFSSPETGKRVTPNEFCAKLTGGENGNFFLLNTLQSANPVMISDMPNIGSVPAGKGVQLKYYPQVACSLGMSVEMPDGNTALCYYLQKGTFVINLLTDDAMLKEAEKSTRTPMYLVEDDIPKPTQRGYTLPATEKVSELQVLIPGEEN